MNINLLINVQILIYHKEWLAVIALSIAQNMQTPKDIFLQNTRGPIHEANIQQFLS